MSKDVFVISSILKCTPPTSIQSDLRPISLTPQLSKIMEGFILKPLLHELQFAMQGRSTTQALVYFIHNIHEALDRGNCSVHAFDIEMVQKRAMRAIFWPIKLCYNASLEAANLLPLTERRANLSEKCIAKNKHSAGPLNNILSSMSASSSYHGYHLRSGSCGSHAFKPKAQRFSNVITCKYRQ